MPSPFPGMDPYLEDPAVWPSFHNRFATELSNELNPVLPDHYYADIAVREEIGIIEESRVRGWIFPDVAVSEQPQGPGGGGAAVLTESRRAVSESIEVEVQFDPARHLFVEIRDARRDHKLITLIEILSPSNKRPGPDREAYERKQREVLESDASLIELDLLRGGRRVLPDLALDRLIAELRPAPHYLVVVNRSWRRVLGSAAYQVFPVGLRRWLPCIPVPLKREEDEILLDLQIVFNRTYDLSPYRRGAVDYAGPVPPPPLSGDDAAWAAELVRPWRERLEGATPAAR